MRIAVTGKRELAASARGAERHNRRAQMARVRFGLWIFPT